MFQGAAEIYRFLAEDTLLGKEIIEERKIGQTLNDPLEILAQSLNKTKRST
jgi:hypothetical protein